MKPIKTIRDIDFGINLTASAPLKERATSRAIVFDKDSNVALLRVVKKNYHKLPGGGVEKGENIEMALRRELLEEIGCSVENVRELAVVEEYRNQYSLHQLSYCFTADLLGKKGAPKFEEDEIADGFEPVWMSLNNAIKTIEAETNIQDYEGKFIQARELVFLKEASKLTIKL